MNLKFNVNYILEYAIRGFYGNQRVTIEPNTKLHLVSTNKSFGSDIKEYYLETKYEVGIMIRENDYQYQDLIEVDDEIEIFNVK